MKSRPYRVQFIAYVVAMMADNIEHVISYWVVFQKFRSPALAGFAVLSHWLPFLFFSVAVGGLVGYLATRGDADHRTSIAVGPAAVPAAMWCAKDPGPGPSPIPT